MCPYAPADDAETRRNAAPDAQQVFVAGEMTGWDAGKRAMQRDASGTWHATLDLEPGRYVLYCFITDREGGPPHAFKGMIDEVEVE